MADLLKELMTSVLGYRRFAAQGGDWGAFITTRLAHTWPQNLIGIHLNLLPLPRNPSVGAPRRTRAETTWWQWRAG
jgi:microsomal epoxide hydrolase